MRIAHKGARIVGTGPIEGDFDVIDIDTDLDPRTIHAEYKLRGNQLVPKLSDKRVALVSVWGVNCGISTYSGYLWEHLKTYSEECHVFAEEENGYTDSPGVSRCWRRGEPLTRLVRELNDFDPDIIFVQHEYGYFPKAAHWISFMGAMAGRNVVVTLHSVYNHPDKSIVEACIPRILVHTNAAREILEAKDLPGQVRVVPHGCLPLEDHRYWPLYGSGHTIVQFGFGFRYKGWDHALHTVAEVKKTHQDVFFTGLLSERHMGQVSDYLLELNELAADLGISENVGLIQGYQSDKTLEAYLRTNRVALFPYRDNGEHTVYGASGAARVAMSMGVPVVASNVPLFDGLPVPRPDSVEGWTTAVLEAFEGSDRGVQDAYLQENSWERTAERYWQYGTEPLG